MHYKIGWRRLATVKSCTRYRRKYTFTIYMFQSSELSAPDCRHVCSKLSEARADSADTPHIVMCVSREREREVKEKQRTVCIVTLYIFN